MAAGKTRPDDDARRLLQSFQRRESGAAGPHPDAQQMIAYVTGALDATALAQVERHVESCGECLDLLEVVAQALEGDSATEVAAGDQLGTVHGQAAPTETALNARWKARQEALFDRLVAQLTHPDPTAALAAAGALRDLSVERIPDRLDQTSSLCRVVAADLPVSVRVAAIRALGCYTIEQDEVRWQALAAVTAALRDAEPDVRAAAQEVRPRLQPAFEEPRLVAFRESARALVDYTVEAGRRIVSTLQGLNLRLSPAYGAGTLDCQGTAFDNRLAYAVTETADHVVEMHFSSPDQALDGKTLRVRVGEGWWRDVPLVRVSSGAVEGFLTIPAQQRTDLPDAAVSIELIIRRDGDAE